MHRARLPSIQCLRCVAAVLVVFHHAITIGHGRSASGAFLAGLPSFNEFGAVGVDIFFVISGFVMAHSICGGPALRPGAFLRRRALRILPLFWLMTLATILPEMLMHGSRPGALSIWNAAAVVPTMSIRTFVSHPAPIYISWTLGFEAIFYAVVALVLHLDAPRRFGALMGTTLLLAAAGLIVRSSFCPLAMALNPILAEFALGALAWRIRTRGMPGGLAKAMVPLGILLLALGLTVDLGQGFSIDPALVIGGRTGVRRTLVWGLPAFLIVLGLASDTGGGRAAFRLLEKAGDASYAIYLVHPATIALVADLGPDRVVGNVQSFAIVVTLAAIAAGMLVHLYVERPLAAALSTTVADKAPAPRWDGPTPPPFSMQR